MFDHVDPRIFWPLLLLFWIGGGLIATYWFGKWVDSRNPLRRTRRVINGRRAMATDWKRPGYLPESWK